MSAHAEQLGALDKNFRAELAIGATRQAIPEDLSREDQRAALSVVIDSLELRRQAIVDGIVESSTASDLISAGSRTPGATSLGENLG